MGLQMPLAAKRSTCAPCAECGAPASDQLKRRVFVFIERRCGGCRAVRLEPMTPNYRAGCFILMVTTPFWAPWWIALLAVVPSVAFLLIDFRLRAGHALRARAAAAAFERKAEPDSPRSATAAGPSAKGEHSSFADEVESAQLLANWTITSSLLMWFLVSLFASAVVIPLPEGRLVITLDFWSKLRLPKLSEEGSSWLAFAVSAYSAAFSTRATRSLSRTLKMSSRESRGYMYLSFLPFINLLTVQSLSARTRQATLD